MGYGVRVDTDRVAAAAAELARMHEDLERAGGALGQALRVVTGATGTGSLAAAAETAAGQWHGGMARVAEHGRELAAATLEAAELYRRAEQLATRAWSLPTMRGTP